MLWLLFRIALEGLSTCHETMSIELKYNLDSQEMIDWGWALICFNIQFSIFILNCNENNYVTTLLNLQYCIFAIKWLNRDPFFMPASY